MGEKNQDQYSVDGILEEHRKQQRKASPPESGARRPSSKEADYDDEYEDVNAYASPDEREEQKESKKKRGLFGRFGKKKNKKPDFVEDDETFYGIQLKPIDEYRKGYNQVTGEFSIDADSYATLFEESKKAIDDGEVEMNLQRIQRERRERADRSMEFTQLKQSTTGIVPPSHTAQMSRPPAEQPPAAQRPVRQETTARPAVKPPPRSRETDSNLQVIPKVSSVYEYRSHGIPTHIINAKVLQEALRSTEMYRTTVKGESTVKRAAPIKKAPEVQQQELQEPVKVKQEQAEEKPKLAAAAPTVTPTAAPQEEHKTKTPAVKQEETAASQAAVSQTAEKPEEKEIAAETEAGTREIPAVDEKSAAEDKPAKTQEIPKVKTAEKQTKQADEEDFGATMEITDAVKKAPASQKSKIVFEELQETGETETDIEDAVAHAVDDPDKKPIKAEKKWVEPQESIEDYNGPEDAKAVSDELKSDMRDLTLRMVITGGCTLVLALLNVIFGGTFGSGQADMGSAPYVYIVLTLVFLGVAIAVNYRTILNGLKAIAAFNASSDSAAAVATVGVCLQALISLFFTKDLVDKNYYLYAAVLTAVLLANSAGKLTMLRRIHSNFRFLTSKEEKFAAHVCENEDVAEKMASKVVVDKPVLVYQSKTGFLQRFLEMSYLPDPAETSSHMLAPVGLVASLVLCIIAMLVTKSIPSALSALAASLIACVAVSNMLAVNMPVSRLSKLARRAGGMVVGYEAVNRFGETNAVAVDAEALFPTGTITLNGIKTYLKRDEVEEAVLAASALVDVIGGPLCGVFEQVITEKEDNLPTVETFEYEYERGMVGRVDGRIIHVGNRALLLNHRIELPAKEEEAQYAVGGKQVLYIAMDAQVVAMMVMTYSGDRRKKNEIQRLEDSGVSLVVRSTDPNITIQMLSRLFGVESLSLTMMNSDMTAEYQELLEADLARSDAVLATKGRIESFMSLVSACVKERRGVNLIVTLQTVAVVLGFVMVALMACLNAIGSLTSMWLLLFEGLWMAVIILIPKLRR